MTDEEFFYLEAMYNEMAATLRKLHDRLQYESLKRVQRKRIMGVIHRQKNKMKQLRVQIDTDAFLRPEKGVVHDTTHR